MILPSTKPLILALLTLMLLVWGTHQLSQSILIHSMHTVDVKEDDQADADYSHEHQLSHNSLRIEHRHPSGSFDHTHENASVPQPVISPYHSVYARPFVVQSGLPVAPLFRFERPPRFFS